jgi:hypothetical protein
MTLDEFLKQLVGQENAQPNVTSIGNENLNVNAYTSPQLGGNVNAATETPAGLLSATLGKEVNKPSYRDYAITKDNLRGGLLNTEGNTSPYAEYITDDIKAQITGGKSPNVSGEYSTNFAGGRGTVGGQYDNVNPNIFTNYTTPLAGGEFTGGANYSNQGLGVNAEYAKKLNDFLFKAGISATPEERKILCGFGGQF